MGGVTKTEVLKKCAQDAIKTGIRSSFWDDWRHRQNDVASKYIDCADPWTILDLISKAEEGPEKQLLLKILDGLGHILRGKTDPVNESAYLIKKILHEKPELLDGIEEFKKGENMKGYLIVSSTADGVTIEMISREEFEKRLNEDGLEEYWGADGFMKEVGDPDPNYWEKNKLLVVKGEIFEPAQEKVVERWKV